MSKTNDELQAELVVAHKAMVTLVEHSQRLAEALRRSMDESLVTIRHSKDIYTEHVVYMQKLDDEMTNHAGTANESSHNAITITPG